MVDYTLYQSLQKLREADDVDSLMLDFTLPGYPDFELMPGGSDVLLTSENLDLYIEKVLDATIGAGVTSQVNSFREGFQELISIHFFDCFSVEDISIMISGEDKEVWDFQGIKN